VQATVYRQDSPAGAAMLDFGALRKIVPPATVGDTGVLPAAREAMEGRVEILGYGPLDFSFRGSDGTRSIVWNLDPSSGTTWPLESPRVPAPVKPGRSGEIKIPWELSRCHHWVTLARAYALSQDQSYFAALMGQWNDWVRANPPGCGVNWLIPMQAAIRAVNWIWTLSILEQAEMADCASDDIRASLLEHGRFLDIRLEFSERPSDHYLADLVGLLYLGIAFRSHRLGRRWLGLAHSRFLSRFRVDVCSDGGFPVGSVGYHRLVTDLFRHGITVTRAADLPLPADWTRIATRQADMLLDMARPDGTPVAFGDADDALVVPEEKPPCPQPDRTGSDAPGKRSVAYPASGFYVMRQGAHGCAIDAFSERKDLPFGYRHNGRLGIEIWTAGKPLVVDPGTFCYTRSSRKRHYFRSTRAHSVAQIDRREHNRTRHGDLAWFGGEGRVSVLHWDAGESTDRFEARLGGHARAITFDKKALAFTIRDRFQGNGHHGIEFRLVLAPGVACSLAGSDAVTCLVGTTPVSVRFAASFPFKLRLEGSFVSPRFGAKLPTRRIRGWGSGPLPAEIVCTITVKGLS